MPTQILVSYDGTTHDDDALALARMLAAAGATLSLAYVRHSQEFDPRREEIGVHDADRRLEQGAIWLAQPDVARHVIIDPSTSSGLARLAASEGAGLVVFGSDYRTTPGRAEPGASAQGLLNGGTTAVGIGAAGLRVVPDSAIKTVSVPGDDPSGAAAQTAQSLAAALGAHIISGYEADLILIDSQDSAPDGKIQLGGATRSRLDSARGSVIVLPKGTPLSF